MAALLHDVGDVLAPGHHSEVSAAMLRPYVSDRVYWIIKHHGLFQGYYYNHHYGEDRNLRDRFKDHEWYEDTVRFCADYDQVSFDPAYDPEPLEFFEPMVRRQLAEPTYGSGVSKGRNPIVEILWDISWQATLCLTSMQPHRLHEILSEVAT